SLAQKNRLPSMYGQKEFADAGGLIAYGPSTAEMWRRAATYVDKILKGAKPGDLPIEQPTKFELVINLRTAKALGLTIPRSLLQRADEIIQRWSGARSSAVCLAACSPRRSSPLRSRRRGLENWLSDVG